jgi:hypothetical protein
LPIDFSIREKPQKSVSVTKNLINSLKKSLWNGKSKAVKDGFYQPHPDPNQEKLFFNLLAEMLQKGIIEQGLIEQEMAKNHVRHDALDLCRKIAA